MVYSDEAKSVYSDKVAAKLYCYECGYAEDDNTPLPRAKQRAIRRAFKVYTEQPTYSALSALKERLNKL
jgi:hypothetical protein